MQQKSLMNLLRIALLWGVVGAGIAAGYGQSLLPDGQWEDHLPYGRVLELMYCDAESPTAGEAGYWVARTEYALFVMHPEDGSLERWSPVRSLSRSTPTAVYFDPVQRWVWVGYSDGTIDVLDGAGERLTTLTDIRNSNLSGDKGIRSFSRFLQPTSEGPRERVLAACGLGVVVLHPTEWDVRDTWYLEGQQSLRTVWRAEVREGKILACTDAGIFEAPENHPFLSSPDAWTRWTDVPQEDGDYRGLAFLPSGEPLVHWHAPDSEGPDDQLWLRQAGVWQPLPGWEEGQIRCWTTAALSPDPADWRLAVAGWNQVRIFDAQLGLVKLDYNAADVPLRANDLVFHHAQVGEGGLAFRDLYVGNDLRGMIRMDLEDTPGRDRAWAPVGPPHAAVRALDCWNDQLWVASGAVDETWTNAYRKHGIYGRDGDRWVQVGLDGGVNDIQGVNDILCVSIDPTDPDHAYFGSWEEGLIEVRDGAWVATYHPGNSPLAAGDFGGSPRTGVGGVDFDAEGNLWFTNAFVPDALQVRLADGTFVAMDLGSALGSDGWLGDVLAARNGYIWAIMPRGQGLLVYDPAGTPAETQDDDWRVLTKENSGLPSNDIYCLEEDLDGEIWIGTGAGPAVIFLPEAAFSEEGGGDLANTILIQQDGNNQLLLETEVIRTICIDGGNRKWIGTANSGAYLFAPNGIGQIHSFNRSNSPLPTNDISDIAIDHSTGAVYFGTDRGLFSFQGDATNFVSEIDGLRVFPNPVRPDHAGPVVVDGLAYNSTVHVTTAQGRWVATLRSEGGRATWDGLGPDGQPVPQGVYVLMAVDREGDTAGTARVAIMR